MTSPDLLIHTRWVVQPHTETVLEDHSVAVTAGRIVDILPSRLVRERYPEPTQTFTLSEHVLIPGLINLHTHAAMSLMRGLADDLPLMTWLSQHIWPAETTHLSPRFVRDGTRLACAEMLKGGITCFNDMYFFLDDAAQSVMETGIRAVLGIVVLDFPSAWADNADAYLERGMETRERWRRHDRLAFCLAPHAPYTVGDASLEKVHTLSAQTGLPIHLHIHETEREIHDHIREHGCRPLARLERLEILGPRFIGVHAAHLENEELDALACHGASIAHCPASNLKLGSGIAPVHAMLERGINLGLGTDGAASNNRLDLFQEMRLASLLAKGCSQNASAVPAWAVLRMATINAARALGLEQEIGSIEIGKCADLCAVELGALELSPCFDPVSHLVHCAGREHVSHVWVQGECHVSDKALTGIWAADLKNTVQYWERKMKPASAYISR